MSRPTESPERLSRALQSWDVLALSIGSVIGVGIFRLPGTAAAAMGPAAIVPLLIGGALAFVLALCYAEAASRTASTGGAMRYTQAAFGDTPGFLVGWATWVARVASWAALTDAFVTYLLPWLPDGIGSGLGRPAIGAGLVLSLTLANLRGVGFGGRLNTALTALKLVPMVAFILIGVWFVKGGRFVPFAPQGFEPLGPTTVTMLYAYAGFEGMVIPAAEMRDPKRHVPRALVLGMGIIILLYVGVWGVCTGTLSDLSQSVNPVADASATFLGPFGSRAIELGVLVSVLGINAFMALVTPRALYALGNARLLPSAFGRVTAGGVPALAIGLTGLTVAVLAATGSFHQLAQISVVARIAQYVPTALAVLRLRVSDPEVPKFRAPGGPILPVLAVAVCIWLLFETDREVLLFGSAAIALGYLPHLAVRR